METYPLRLHPGQDLKRGLDALAKAKNWPAACVVMGIGSLRSAPIRFANAEMPETIEGPLEILSLGGSLSPDGSHLHILVSDGGGVTKGGHLTEGAIISTTAEIVVGVLSEWHFSREIDSETGYAELIVNPQADAETSHHQE